MTSRILGIDAGSVRVGLAISDPFNSYAMPLEVVPAKKAMDRIRALIEEHGVGTVVVGMPLTLRGEIGPQAEVVRTFIDKLAPLVAPVPIETADERLTSKQAETIVDAKKKDMRDAVAASLMLESYLAARKRRR